jgi:hypothetical protein
VGGFREPRIGGHKIDKIPFLCEMSDILFRLAGTQDITDPIDFGGQQFRAIGMNPSLHPAAATTSDRYFGMF